MGWGSNAMTSTTLANYIPVIKGALIVAREQKPVLSKLVERHDADVAADGKTVQFPLVSSLTATAVSDNTAVTFQSPTETQVTMTLNRYYESSFAIQDDIAAQSAYSAAKQYGDKAEQALLDQQEADLAGLYSGLTQTQGNGMTALTEAMLVRGIQYLDDAKAPETERFFVCKPAAMNNIRQISRFTEFQTMGNAQTPMVGGNRGLVTNVFGVEVYMTTAILQVAGTPGIIHNLLFHRSAFALAEQIGIRLKSQDRPDYLGMGYVASSLWGYTEMRDNHAVDIRTVMQS